MLKFELSVVHRCDFGKANISKSEAGIASNRGQPDDSGRGNGLVYGLVIPYNYVFPTLNSKRDFRGRHLGVSRRVVALRTFPRMPPRQRVSFAV